jgi:cell shape-determining protein MreC
MIPPAYARYLMPLTLGLLVLTGLMIPVRYLTWLSGFGRLSQTIIAPISHPLAALSRSLAPADKTKQDSESVRALLEEKEGFKVQLLQALDENDHLRQVIKELQRGHALDPELAVLLLSARVVGSATDLSDGLLTVRAGTKQGVEQNTVATALGLQLLGRVVSVGAQTSTVAPITAKASGSILAVIMIDESTNGLSCPLVPTGDGTLYGDVEDRRTPDGAAQIDPVVGEEVRLRDPKWPRNSQMLLIGRVEKVEPSPKQPLRKVVTVRPTIDNLERVSEVVLRLSPDADDGSDAKPTAAARPAGGHK